MQCNAKDFPGVSPRLDLSATLRPNRTFPAETKTGCRRSGICGNQARASSSPVTDYPDCNRQLESKVIHVKTMVLSSKLRGAKSASRRAITVPPSGLFRIAAPCPIDSPHTSDPVTRRFVFGVSHTAFRVWASQSMLFVHAAAGSIRLAFDGPKILVGFKICISSIASRSNLAGGTTTTVERGGIIAFHVRSDSMPTI